MSSDGVVLKSVHGLDLFILFCIILRGKNALFSCAFDNDDDDSDLPEDRLLVLGITRLDFYHRSTRPDEHVWSVKDSSYTFDKTIVSS